MKANSGSLGAGLPETRVLLPAKMASEIFMLYLCDDNFSDGQRY